ncbi:uncharacterized protein LOC110857188 [Folsomia candida]|uniref:Uncharacterized protein n=1 Tax=Folsomia candida TaxID=158441 RepID=A0A226DJ85_FOLCA|nr:uncharacterized protein LOC110857188 [Folsomia candida]OXA44914.1 hypothetical protein Fcan01_20017 [Folsomia candida]
MRVPTLFAHSDNKIKTFVLICMIFSLRSTEAISVEQDEPRIVVKQEESSEAIQTIETVGNLITNIFKGIAEIPATSINAVLKPFLPQKAETTSTPAPGIKQSTTTPKNSNASASTTTNETGTQTEEQEDVEGEEEEEGDTDSDS